MVLYAAVITGISLILWSLAHWAFSWFFKARVVHKNLASRSNVDSTYCPKVSVLMSLRGCDPSLEENLTGLLTQTYEDYEVIVVVDSRQDAAWKVVERTKQLLDVGDRLKYFELENPRNHCGLKCNSLVQATGKMNPESEVIVLIDADVIPHAEWLQHAVAPLADPKIGVVTGNQWYAPAQGNVGSLVRSLWNSASLVPAAIYQLPWAGSCAMRMEDVRSSGLIDLWKRSIVDDGPIKSVFEEMDLKVHFEPRLIMVNRDHCDVKYVCRYVTRMLTWSRIYEKTFFNTVIHLLMSIVFLALVAGTAAAAVVAGNWFALGLLGGLLLIANLIMYWGYATSLRAVQKVIAANGQPPVEVRLTDSIKLFLLVPLTQFVHCGCMFQAMLSKKICWRDITYLLKGSEGVEMVAYRPYEVDNETAARNVSI